MSQKYGCGTWIVVEKRKRRVSTGDERAILVVLVDWVYGMFYKTCYLSEPLIIAFITAT